MNCSHKAFLRNKLQELVPKIQTALNSGRTSRRDQSWYLRLVFEAKMAISHDGTCPRDLLQGLVPSCVLTFTVVLFRTARLSTTEIHQGAPCVNCKTDLEVSHCVDFFVWLGFWRGPWGRSKMCCIHKHRRDFDHNRRHQIHCGLRKGTYRYYYIKFLDVSFILVLRYFDFPCY